VHEDLPTPRDGLILWTYYQQGCWRKEMENKFVKEIKKSFSSLEYNPLSQRTRFFTPLFPGGGGRHARKK